MASERWEGPKESRNSWLQQFLRRLYIFDIEGKF